MTDLIKKIADPKWRLQNLYKIVDKQSKTRVFKPNCVQKVIQASPAKRKKILKARQFGVTTDAVLRRLDSVIWNPNRTACILAHKREILDKIFSIVKVAYENLPEELKPEIDRGGGSKYEMRFPRINSKIYTTLEVRGGTINELHISESAFIPWSRIKATLQSVPLDGLVEHESTPNGLNDYYDLWTNDQDYTPFFFPWFFHDEYQIATEPFDVSEGEFNLVDMAKRNHGIDITYEQLAWRRWKIRELRGLLNFLAEYPEDDQSCFLSSGSNPFEDLNALKKNMNNAPTGHVHKSGIRIYEKFDKDCNYVIGADPAEGVRSDYSVATCICIETGREVAFVRGHYKPADFAEKIYEIGKLYSRGNIWPLAIIERNNHGHAVILKLNETLRYPALWVDKDDRIGHMTTSTTRPLLIDTFIDAMNEETFGVRSRETYGECLTLVDNNGKIEADQGKHDDCVMATALAFKVALDRAAKIRTYRDISKRVLV